MFEDDHTYYLGIDGEFTEAHLERIENVAQICARTDMEHVLTGFVSSIRMQYLPPDEGIPAALPQPPQRHYFVVNITPDNPYWERIQADKNIAVKCHELLAQTPVQLIAVTPS